MPIRGPMLHQLKW